MGKKPNLTIESYSISYHVTVFSWFFPSIPEVCSISNLYMVDNTLYIQSWLIV